MLEFFCDHQMDIGMSSVRTGQAGAAGPDPDQRKPITLTILK